MVAVAAVAVGATGLVVAAEVAVLLLVAAAAVGAAYPVFRQNKSRPGKQSIEQRRLVRMVATHALDRLQQLDPLNLFKDPVSGVPGYTEAIEFPIDFTTIRRRSQWGLYGSIRDLALDVQLLCANAMAFNDADSIYYTEAT